MRRIRATHIQRGLFLLAWTCLGLSSYGLFHLSILPEKEIAAIASPVSLLSKPILAEQQIEDEKITSEEDRIIGGNVDKKNEARSPDVTVDDMSPRLRKTKKRAIARAAFAELIGFDWTFWGAFACFALVAYVRIRLEPAHDRLSRRQRGGGDDGNNAVAQALRRINRERELRGEAPVSMDTYRTLRQLVLQDRTLLRALAGHDDGTSAVGATPEQIERCSTRNATADELDHDCSICLATFQKGENLRQLPCHHPFHVECIDQWLLQSTLCPMCKHSI
eukprot:Nitzschia sp. Nitz4//scaffold125_size66327//24423//25256//NITZ4_006129-RA/size66327-exonerate_est2genome-gene-0.79-mRNA-1//1//CDS//3329534607//1686//frame0